ncbi:uncharacterized protein LOC141854054 [Brevipalpus obovatus]|uniref:uncharacterized protein LOC141854054 n=1 Tax=Brevipalpus obovatus TaxID=246614 RepID=UPI003D9F493C
MSKLIAGLVIFTLFYLVSGQRAVSKSDDCKKKLTKADECLKKIIYIGDWNLTLIRSDADLGAHCKLTKEKFACVKNYQRCLNNFPREVFNILSRNARKMNKERCEDPKGRAEFLKHIQCMDESTMGVNVCMDKVIRLFEYLAKNVSGDRDEMLSSTCCAVHRGLDCFTTKVKKVCNKKTGAATDVYFTEKVNELVNDVFDLACADYSTISACQKKKPKLMAEFDSITEPESKIPRSKTSALIPMMKVIEKIKLE